MIHFIMFCFFVYGLYWIITDDEEHNAMCYVGPTEFEKAKNSMTKKDFNQYVEKNSKLMKKAMDDAKEYHRKNRK